MSPESCSTGAVGWLTAGMVMRQSGATSRQVDHWVKRRYLVALDGPSPGSGNPHRFGPAELYVARLLVVLVKFHRKDGIVNRATLRKATRRVRSGRLGLYELMPGVTLNLDLICAEWGAKKQLKGSW